MGILLALASAIIFGGADFAGGNATRRNESSFPVVFVSQLVGFTTVLLIAPWFGFDEATWPDIGWGASAGIVGVLGLLLFYKALAVGTMSIVSPITAVVSAAVPVAVGLARGERPSVMALVGIALGLAALTLFGGGDPGHGSGNWVRALAPAVLSGLGFGAFFSLIATSSEHAGLVPLVAARFAAVGLLLVFAIRQPNPMRLRREVRGQVVLAGTGDIAANALFLVASRHGDLAIVGVIAALYPASTLVLARYLLHERLTRLHQIAIGLATIAVILIASA